MVVVPTELDDRTPKMGGPFNASRVEIPNPLPFGFRDLISRWNQEQFPCWFEGNRQGEG